MKSVFAAVFMFLMPAVAVACGLENSEVIQLDSDVEIFYRTQATPIPVAEHFTLQLQICRGGSALEVQQFKVDANMPMHGHGMNYRPDVTRLADGAYRIQGLMFHMTGKWRVEMSFKLPGDAYKAHFDYQL